MGIKFADGKINWGLLAKVAAEGGAEALHDFVRDSGEIEWPGRWVDSFMGKQWFLDKVRDRMERSGAERGEVDEVLEHLESVSFGEDDETIRETYQDW